MVFSLRVTVKPARDLVDFRRAGCKIAFERFDVTVTAAKWEIPDRLSVEESYTSGVNWEHHDGEANGRRTGVV